MAALLFSCIVRKASLKLADREKNELQIFA